LILIIKSECLKEVLYEIDVSNDILEIVISKEKDYFRFSSFGVIGDTHVNKFIKLCNLFLNFEFW